MNHKYFETWSSEMAYYLGWIWADGSIGKQLQLGCITEDEEIIIGFIKAINSHHKIIRKPAKIHKKGYNIAAYTKVAIWSKELVQCLIKKHRVLPRKTYLNPSFPEMDNKYLPDFIRGYFDGDGAICKNNNKIIISIVGTKKFIKGLQNIICKIANIPSHPIYKSKNTKAKNAGWYISWAKKSEVASFLKYIYYDDKCVSLSRKKKLSNEYYKEIYEYLNECGIENKNGRIRLRFLSKNLGEYETIEECKFARNYAYLKVKGFKYPVDCQEIDENKKSWITKLVDTRLSGNKTHQRLLKEQS
jgi:hypothetical protein